MADKKYVIEHVVRLEGASGSSASGGVSDPSLKKLEAFGESLNRVMRSLEAFPRSIDNLSKEVRREIAQRERSARPNAGEDLKAFGRTLGPDQAYRTLLRDYVRYQRFRTKSSAPMSFFANARGRFSDRFASPEDFAGAVENAGGVQSFIREGLRSRGLEFRREIGRFNQAMAATLADESLRNLGRARSAGLPGALIRAALPGAAGAFIMRGAASVLGTLPIQAQYAAGAPFAGAQQAAVLNIETTNRMRQSIAAGISSGLSGAGLAVGGAAGAALAGTAAGSFLGPWGAILGGAVGFIGAEVAGKLNEGRVAAQNVATRQSYLLGQTGLQAYLTAAPANASLRMVHAPHSRFPVALPTGGFAEAFERGHIQEALVQAQINRAFKRYGMSETSSSALTRHLTALAGQGVDVSSILPAMAFMVAQGGSATGVLDQIIRTSRTTGMSLSSSAGALSLLSATTSLGNRGASAAFLRSAAPFGSAFEGASRQFVSQGPLEQFQRSLMMKALFGVDAKKLYEGTSSQRAKERDSFVRQVNELNREGGEVPIGGILGELVSGGASQFYATYNAPSGGENLATPQSPVPWNMIEAPAARAAEERAVKTMRVSTLIVEKEAEHKTVAHAMTFPPYTWGII